MKILVKREGYNQGRYKKRVKNDGFFFEIPTLLSCKRGNPAENRVGKFKIYMYVILNFPALDFLVHMIKEREFKKKICHALSYIYTYS